LIPEIFQTEKLSATPNFLTLPVEVLKYSILSALFSVEHF